MSRPFRRFNTVLFGLLGFVCSGCVVLSFAHGFMTWWSLLILAATVIGGVIGWRMK